MTGLMFIKFVMRAQDAALCLVRKWWRPLTQIGIGGAIFNVGIVLPLRTWTYPDLVGLAALITAAAPFAIMRGFEKKWGAEDA